MARGEADEPARAVRVFVSSTFRDMQAERDELVKRIFPELRRRCDERGVAWSEVDLRWGVTDEEKAEGAVLPICLAEIEHSRPYFVGILGDRYGWVPDELPVDLTAREPWLQGDAGRSVTELEMLHGVLNDPAMAGRALFYLRDPGYVASLPAGEQGLFLEAPTPEEVTAFGPDEAERRAHDRRERLGALKRRLRASGFPVRDYADPFALGPLVLRDLGAMVDELFPAGQAPDPQTTAEQAQRAFARARVGLYVGAERRLAAVDAATASGSVLVTGPAGIGTSTLLAAWAARRRGVVVSHHAAASGEASNWQELARRVAVAVASQAGIDLADLPSDPVALRAALADVLRTAGGLAPVTLVLDGLDELDDAEHARDLVWLPWPLPPGVTVVGGGRGDRLREAAHARGWTEVELAPLDASERRELVVAFLACWAKRLDDTLVQHLAKADLTGNPLVLRTVLDELRQHGDHFTLAPLLDAHLDARSVDDVFEVVLARWERDLERDRPGLVGEALTLVSASRFGLGESDLLELLGSQGAPLPAAVWSPLHLTAGEHLVRRAGLLALAHEPMRAAVRDRYLPDHDARLRVHRRLAEHVARRPFGPGVVAELTWQLRHAEAWEQLERALASPTLLAAAYQADLTEVRTAWAALEAAVGPRRHLTYAAVVADPAAHRAVVWEVARLLEEGGHPDEARRLYAFLVDDARGRGDEALLVAALGNLAASDLARGETAAALVALAEQDALARRRNDDDALQRVLGNQAVAARQLGDLDGALALLAEDEAICRRRGDHAGLQASLANRGAVLRDRRDFDGALATFTAQEEAARRVGDPSLVNKALVNQAQVLADRGDLEAALGLLARQERECRSVGDLAGLAANLGNRAALLVQQGRLDEAADAATEEAGLATRLRDPVAARRSCFVRATIAHLRGDGDVALALLDEHRALAEAAADRSAMALGLGERATILRERGDAQGALSLHIEEEHLYRELRDPTGVAASLGNQASARQQLGDTTAALGLVAEQERLLREANVPAMLQAALGSRAALLLATGDLDGAERALAEKEALCRSLGHRAGLATCLGNQGLVAHHRGDLATAQDKHHEQERICRDIGDRVGLVTSLGNQAAVAVQQGDAVTAVRLLDAQLSVAMDARASTLAVRNLVVQQRVRLAVGDLAGFQAAVARAEAQARAAGDAHVLAQCLAQRGTMAMADTSGPALLEEAAALARASSNPDALQLAIGNLGLLAVQRGDAAGATVLLEEQVEVCRAHHIAEGLPAALGNLAIARQQDGDGPGALALLVEQEAICRAQGDAQGLVLALANRGEVTARLPGRRAEGLGVLAEAAAVARQVGWAAMVPQIEQLAAQLRAQP